MRALVSHRLIINIRAYKYTIKSIIGYSQFRWTQPQKVICKGRCSEKFHKLHRKTPVLESLFNKVAGLIPATLLKRDAIAGVFMWNLRNFEEHLFEDHLQTTASDQISFSFLHGRTFSWPTALGLNYFFTAPNYEITFSRYKYMI